MSFAIRGHEKVQEPSSFPATAREISEKKFGGRQRGYEMNSEVNTNIWGFSTAGRIFFGWGVVSELRNVPREFGQRVLLCTDKNIVKAGICETVLALLREAKADVKLFDEGRPEVDRETIEKAA